MFASSQQIDSLVGAAPVLQLRTLVRRHTLCEAEPEPLDRKLGCALRFRGSNEIV
jgi:hypothetical protein